MEPIENIEEIIRKKLNATPDPALHDRILTRVRQAKAKDETTTPAPNEPVLRRPIMQNPITKLAIAAAIIAAVVLGLFEFVSTDTGSGVVWAEVVNRVEASRGLICRERTFPSGESDEGAYVMYYVSPARARIDTFKGNEVTRSIYLEYTTKDMLFVQHSDKCYGHHPMDDRDVQDRQRQLNLKGWVEDLMSRPHTNLGRRTLEGVPCEGLETKYRIFGDTESPDENSARRIWVSVETGYPILYEWGSFGSDGKLRVEAVLDQFQWDVELDAREFEPEIPADYEQM